MLDNRLFILIACEESQAECIAFRDLGFDAYSCDLQNCKKGAHPEWHIKGDVTPYLKGRHSFKTLDGKLHIVPRWDLIIAHPPCTYLCKLSAIHMRAKSDGVIWLNGEKILVNAERLKKMKKARLFFFLCLHADATYVAVENPQPMRIAMLPKPDAFACPSWYGSKYTKKTFYWLKNLPPLFPQLINTKTRCYCNCSSGKYRSRTYPGLAKAIAEQWSQYILTDKKRTSCQNQN